MSLLDKLHEKALENSDTKLKYPLSIASGIADWVAATSEEITAHKEAFKNTEDERVGENDYRLYQTTGFGSMAGEALVLAYFASHYQELPFWGIILDLMIRNINSGREGKIQENGKRDGNFTGIIGTVRARLYDVVDKLGRSEEEPEAEIEEDMP